MKKFEGKSNAYGKIIEKYRKNKNMSRADVSRELDLIDIPINPDSVCPKLYMSSWPIILYAVLSNDES